MKKFLEKRSKALFTAVGINIIYFIYLSILYLIGGNSELLKEQNLYMYVYYMITLPSYIFLAITVLTSALGLVLKKSWLNISSLITGAISIILNPIYAVIGAPIYIGNIVGVVNQFKLNKKIKNKEKIEKVKLKDLEIIYIILIIVAIIFIALLVTLGLDVLEILRVLVFEKTLKI